MASVYVTNNNSGVVRGAAIAVFEDNGYKLARRDGETLVFEKQASKMNDIAYGNWTESRVWDRVKVRIQTLDETLIRLSCTGYLVRDKGGPTEEEVKPYRRTPYQKLLEQVGARLGPVKTSQP